MWIRELTCSPAAKKGLALLAEGSANSSTACSTVAAAVSLPFIAYHVIPQSFTAKADALAVVADATTNLGVMGGIKAVLGEVLPILSVFSPKNLLMIYGRNMGIQVLLKFNIYMMQLLEHEKQSLEAEEQGQQAPEAPPVPDFKPCFETGFWNGNKEAAVAAVRKVFEWVAVRRLGMIRADALIRDHKLWIKDVLAFKYRLDPVMTRFVKYQFAVLHSSVLFFCAECTVSVILHVRKTLRSNKSTKQKSITIVRGATAQVLRCTVRLCFVSAGAAACSLAKPGIGTSIGYLVFDMGALAATAQVVDLITGE